MDDIMSTKVHLDAVSLQLKQRVRMTGSSTEPHGHISIHIEHVCRYNGLKCGQ
uniref:Uncharacterized protein n=1 Tax=Anguilla anguilla TaxID=7936 RepID=A0A0E9R975_ANGAN